MNIEHGCALDDAEAIAALFFDGFEKEARRVFSRPESLAGIIRRSINPSTFIAAREDGELVGMAVLDLEDRHLFSPRLGHFTAEYGRLQGLCRFPAMLLLDCFGSHHGLFYLDTLATRNDRRGTGLGTALLEEVEREAARQGYPSVVLDVVDENPRAMKLYQCLGYQPIEHHRRPFSKPLFGYSGYTRMEKKL